MNKQIKEIFRMAAILLTGCFEQNTSSESNQESFVPEHYGRAF